MSSPGEIAYKLSFQISPIILTGGIARLVGGMLPIIAITESLDFALGLLSGGSPDVSLDNFFASYEPLPGSRLIAQKVGLYPYANQQVASNAVIQQPLNISMLMICPVRKSGGYAAKLATMMALQSALTQHNNSGGTYTIATPSYIYTNCLLLDLHDASGSDSKQPQNRYVWDFLQPLLTLQQAQEAQNNLMQKITDGTALNGQPAWSGLGPTVGVPSSLAGSSVIPSLAGPVGASTAVNIPASGPS